MMHLLKRLTGAIAALMLAAGTASAEDVTDRAATGNEGTEGLVAKTQLPYQPGQDADHSGSFSYSHPLQLPPGTNGMAPNLGLRYNSGASNGPVGMGFVLDGLSTISIDTSFAVNFDAGDHYILDGQKLYFVGGSDNSFHTENEGFEPVRLYNSIAGAPSNPNTATSYWVVYKKDGTQWIYGQTADSHIDALGKNGLARVWALNKVMDTLGNYYSVEYLEDAITGAYYPLAINYTKNDTHPVSSWKRVQFSYEGRADDGPMYSPTKIDTDKRLRWITVLSGVSAISSGQLVRKYSLSYQYSSSTGRSQVVAIQEYGTDGNWPAAGYLTPSPAYTPTGSLLPSVRMEWVATNEGFVGEAQLTPPLALSADILASNGTTIFANTTGVQFVDLNGDGRPDLVYNRYLSVSGTTQAGAFLSTSSGWTAAPQYTPPVALSADILASNGATIFANITGAQFVDLNGDGRPDLAYNRYFSVSGTTQAGAYLNTSSGWTAAPQYTPPVSLSADILTTDGKPVFANIMGSQFVDLNGDGRPDLVYNRYLSVSGTTQAGAYLNTSSGWTAAPQYTPPVALSADILASNGATIFANITGAQFVDLNGDGRPDLAYNRYFSVSGTTQAGAYLNTSSGWTAAPQYTPPVSLSADILATDGTPVFANIMGSQFVDLNGDGRPDLVYNRYLSVSGTTQAGAYLNTSSGWTAVPEYAPPVALSADILASSGATIFANIMGAKFVDLNGDEKPDLAYNRYFSVSGTTQAGAYLNTSSGWTVAPEYTPPVALSVDIVANNGTPIFANIMGAQFVDLNGDGSSDLAYNRYLSVSGTTLSGAFIQQTKPDLLTSIILPTGGKITATYTPAPQVPGAIDPTQSVYPRIANTAPRALVTKIETDPGMGPKMVSTYAYTGGMRIAGLAADRVDLGFARVTKTDVNTGTEVVTEYWQEVPKQGKPKLVTTKNGATILAQTATTYAVIPTASTDGKVNFVYASEIENRNFDGQTTALTTKKLFDYGTDGNRGEVKTVTSLGYSGAFDAQSVVENFTWAQRIDATHNLVRLASKEVRSANETGVHDRTSYSEILYDDLSLGNINVGLATENRVQIDATPQFATTKMTYDLRGNLVNHWDPVAFATGASATQTLTYAAPYFDLVETQTNALSQVTTTNYDSATRLPVSQTDPNGQVVTLGYDPFGRPVSVIKPGDDASAPTVTTSYTDAVITAGALVTPAYTTTSQKTSGTNRIETSTWFDGLGRTIVTKRPGANGWITGEWFYDASGRNHLVTVPIVTTSATWSGRSDPLTALGTRYTFDNFSRVTTQTNPDTSTAKTFYNQNLTWSVDENGHLSSVKDELGVTTSKRYLGDWSTFTLTTAPATAYSNTITGQYRGLTRLTDNAGNVSDSRYDLAGRRTSYTSGDTGTWNYSYNLNGQLATQTDAKGQSVGFTYDALGRLAAKTATDTSVNATYTYDTGTFGVGRLATITYHRGSDAYSYDQRGRVTSTTKTLDGIAKTQSATYDSADRTVTTTYPDGEVVTSGYGTDGNQVSLSGTDNYVTAITYNNLGKVVSQTYGNGVVTNYAYYDDATLDPTSGLAHSYRLKSITAGTSGSVMNLTYSYDRGDNIKTRTDGNNAAYNEAYTYDDLDRLTAATSTAYGSLAYTYSPDGNILTKEGASFTYNPARPHAVASNGTHAYTYDANGNLTNRDGTARVIAYDFENRVVSMTDGGTMVYNDARQRTIKEEGTKKTLYFFANYEQEYTAGTLTNTIQRYSANGQTVAERSTADGLNFVHADHLGSSTRMTSAAGTLVRTQGYKPYGGDAYLSGTVTTKKQYTGQEREANDLYYYNARYYDPELGRFTQADPAVVDGRYFGRVSLSLGEYVNVFGYGNNNPLTATDPTGLKNVVDNDEEGGAIVDNSDGTQTNTSSGRTTTVGSPGTEKERREAYKRESESGSTTFNSKEAAKKLGLTEVSRIPATADPYWESKEAMAREKHRSDNIVLGVGEIVLGSVMIGGGATKWRSTQGKNAPAIPSGLGIVGIGIAQVLNPDTTIVENPLELLFPPEVDQVEILSRTMY